MDPRADGLPLVHPARAAAARPGYDLPLLVILFVMFLLATLLVTRLAIFAFEIFIRDANMSTDPTPVAVTVGGVALHVPHNMIRLASERGGAQPKLDLHLHWPSLEGFSPERAHFFQTSAADTPVIYVTIGPAAGTMASEERFRQVYPRVLTDEVSQSSKGFLVRRFRTGHGYDGEELLIARDPERPLAARCEPAGSAAVPTCIVEFRSELGLDATYRFRRALLADWRAIDAGLRRLIDSLAARPD